MTIPWFHMNIGLRLLIYLLCEISFELPIMATIGIKIGQIGQTKTYLCTCVRGEQTFCDHCSILLQ